MIGMGALYGARTLSAGKQLPDDDALNTGLVVSNTHAHTSAHAHRQALLSAHILVCFQPLTHGNPLSKQALL